MNRAEAYRSEIESLKSEISRLREHMRRLTAQKKKAEHNLYNHMERTGLDKVGRITKKSIAPKNPPKPRKKKADKQRDAIQLFYETGIPDPEAFWDELQATQQ